jgi:hypothetical protein
MMYVLIFLSDVSFKERKEETGNVLYGVVCPRLLAKKE